MAGNTTASVQSNLTFTTGVVPIVVGVLNPANSPQSVWDCGVGMNYASIDTVVTGSPASFTIVLEGTYDGNTWTTLATTTNVAGEVQYSTGAIPFTNLRARCTAVTGGSSPTVNVFVTASQTPIQITAGGTSPANNVAITSPIDGNGNLKVAVQGSVNSAQVNNRYFTQVNSGNATAPTAGTALATLSLFDFYYLVTVVVGFGTVAETTAIDNFQLKAGTTVIGTCPVANVINSQSQTHTFYVNPGVNNLTVNVIANASTGAVYKATVTATRLV